MDSKIMGFFFSVLTAYRQVLISWTTEYMEKNFHGGRCGEGLRKEKMIEC